MKRLFGIETEYGISTPGGDPRTQMRDSRRLVEATKARHVTGWDYALESPRADLRGFTVARLQNDPIDAQWDRDAHPEDDDRSDRILENGARFYNDHGHPEYATPECSRLLELVAHDRAGERIALAAAKEIGATLYKNNSDYSGASYGTHENYLVPRALGYEGLAASLVPLMVCRQIFVGAGKVGSETRLPVEYQISQRADFLTEVASVDTLYRRPIFNTRDEPHADSSKWIRLHVICGDANRSEWATAMKVGMIRIGLDLAEIGEAPAWRFVDPARAFFEISRDGEFCWKIALDKGSWTTAPDVLESYLAAGERHLRGKDAETDWILNEWQSALLDAREDPMRLADRADWAAKLGMLRTYAEDIGKWDIDTLRAVEMEYHDIDPEASLYDVLVDMGRVRTLLNVSRIEEAMNEAPNTRAKLRAQLVREQADRLETIGWRRAIVSGEIVEFDLEGTE